MNTFLICVSQICYVGRIYLPVIQIPYLIWQPYPQVTCRGGSREWSSSPESHFAALSTGRVAFQPLSPVCGADSGHGVLSSVTPRPRAAVQAVPRRGVAGLRGEVRAGRMVPPCAPESRGIHRSLCLVQGVCLSTLCALHRGPGTE